MTSYKKISGYPRKFLAMTGYTVAEFEALYCHLSSLNLKLMSKPIS